jgi:hypothetical protein
VNVYDEMTDDEVLRTASESLSALPVASAPDVHAIMARGRARQRRRLAGAASLTAAAGAVALCLRLAAPGPPPGGTAGTIRTAAFVLTHNADGTDTLTLNLHQVLDPNALQQALSRDGVPALIKVNADCWSSPAPPSATASGVVSLRLPGGAAVPMPSQNQAGPPLPADVEVVIRPAAIPAGTELFIGYRSLAGLDMPARLRVYHLIDISSRRCSTGVLPGGTAHS